jgi:hypothetical protein
MFLISSVEEIIIETRKLCSEISKIIFEVIWAEKALNFFLSIFLKSTNKVEREILEKKNKKRDEKELKSVIYCSFSLVVV